MPSPILAAGKTEAASSPVVVTAGAPKTVSLFCAQKLIPVPFKNFLVKRQGVVGEQDVVEITYENPSIILVGAGTYVIYRPDITMHGQDVGVQLED